VQRERETIAFSKKRIWREDSSLRAARKGEEEESESVKKERKKERKKEKET